MCVIYCVYMSGSLVAHAVVRGLIWNYYKNIMLIVGSHLDSSQVGILSACSSAKLIAPSKSFILFIGVKLLFNSLLTGCDLFQKDILSK